MGRPLARKKRTPLVVEFLEDRQLLSHFGPSPGGDLAAQEVAGRLDLQPTPIRGPMVAPSDHSDRPTAPDGATNNPASSFTPRGDGVLVATGPAGACASQPPALSPTTSGDAPRAISGRSDLNDAGPAGNLPVGTEFSSLMSLVATARVVSLGRNAMADDSGGPAPGPARASAPNVVEAESLGHTPSRGAAPEPFASSGANFVPTSRQGPAAPLGPGGAFHAETGTAAVPSTVVIAAPNPSVIALPNGTATLEPINGPGTAGGPPRVALADGGARGLSDPRSSADTPPAPGRDAQETEVGSEVVEVPGTRPEDVFEAPAPQAVDMITSLLPFDRSSMEAAIDQFLEPFDGLASSIPGLRGPMGLVAASMAVAVTVLTVDVALRLRRSRGEEVGVAGEEGLVMFPGLPGARRWSRP